MRNILIAVGAAVSFTSSSEAGIFVSTGHTGPQVQCDYQHTQHWTYSVSADVSDITGGLFTMKRGSQTTAMIDFVIFEGEYSAYGFATNLFAVRLGPEAFTTQFAPVMFAGSPIALLAGHTYTAVLASDAPDPQSQAYFIKGGGESPLSFVGDDGEPWDGGSEIIPAVPAPGVITLAGVAGLACRRRRRTG